MNNHFKSIIRSISFVCLLLLSGNMFVLSDNLATWNFTDWNPTKAARATAPVTTQHQQLTVSNLTLGSGMSSTPTYFSNNVFGGEAKSSYATTLAEAISKNEYFEFTLTPSSGKYLTVTSIDFAPFTQNTVRYYSLFSGKNGFTAANVIATVTADENNNWKTFIIPDHVDQTAALTFRIYSYGTDDIRWKPIAIGLRKSPATVDLQVNGICAAPDLQPPTAPAWLTATSVGATGLRLNWTASTDDNQVVGYNIYNDATLIGTTTTILFFNVMGLTPATAYTFSVRAKDSANKLSEPVSINISTAQLGAGYVPKLPIGMNIGSFNYYTSQLCFTDAMKMSGDMFTYYSGGPWDSQKIAEITRDINGYPTKVPFTTSDGNQSMIRLLLNNFYSGDYVLTFDGSGTIEIGGLSGVVKVNNNKYSLTFTGTGSNTWLNITSSIQGNHVRNVRILPKIYENATVYPTFNAKFLDGLRPFHAFRFMDWIQTNGSNESSWSTRVTKDYYSQGTTKGASYDYAIELCNELDADAWVTIPHKADDNFITQAAILWRDGLRPNRKVYLEFSNEIWNWQFAQTSYINDNAPGHPNANVSNDLAAIQTGGGNFPEKDAYMMARCFRLWKPQFTGSNVNRLVRVATGQHGWADNTRRILNYLFDVDKSGCDMFSVGGYFNFQEKDHLVWNSKCASVTPLEVIDSTFADYNANEGSWTDNTANFINERGIPYIVYEGGQHMQPYLQGEWCYNQAVYDAQIHPKMYDLYMYNFEKMTSPVVDCKLFMAFSYMGTRQSRWGSWGHLESLNQIGSAANYMTIAPKYQALLDANSAKSDGQTTNSANSANLQNTLKLYPNLVTNELSFDFGQNVENAKIEIYDLDGRIVKNIGFIDNRVFRLNVCNLKSGVYLVRMVNNENVLNSKFIKN